MMSELLRVFPNLLLVLLFLSCSVSAPIIRESKWDIVVVKDIEKDMIYETLSIFLNCYDEDGENDIETIYLIDDEDGIYWELNSDNWNIKTIDDTRWIGSRNLMLPDRSPIPRVPIRIHVRDLAGETVEDKLYISKRKLEEESLNFPELLIENNNLSIKHYDHGIISIYSGRERLLQGEIGSNPKNFKDIFGESRDHFEESINFFVTVKDRDLTLRSGPWY